MDAVRVIPRDRGIGTVGVVVAASDGAPKQALLDEIQQDLDSVREIAVDVQVMAPELQSVDVTVKLWPKQKTSFADASAAVQTALCTASRPSGMRISNIGSAAESNTVPAQGRQQAVGFRHF